VAYEKNKLYYGDNLEVLERYVKDETVDLVYLDPPFNSRQDYNVLFAEKDGSQSSSPGVPTDRSSSVGWRDSRL
jgi:16S rRNA G966 N2-methylase RsmD